MNKKPHSFLVITLSTVLLASCALPSGPDCADTEVKNTVIDIANDEYKNKILLGLIYESAKKEKERMISEVFGESIEDNTELNKLVTKFMNEYDGKYEFLTYEGVAYRNVKYNDLSKIKEDNHLAKKILEVVDNRLDKLKLTVNNVRTNSKNDSIKKVQCAGDLMVDGEKVGIEYSAQHNDEGNVYVEVSGL